MLPPVVTTGRVSPVVLMRKPPRTAARSRQRRCSAPAASDRRSPVTSGVAGQVGVQGHDQRFGRPEGHAGPHLPGELQARGVLGGLELRLGKVAAGEPQLHLPQVHHHAGIDVELVAAAGVEVAGGVQGVAGRRQAHVPARTAMDVLQGGPDVQPRPRE